MVSFTPGIWVYLTLISIMLTFGVVSNILVVYCVIKYKKLRTVTNLLICNLAVSDVLLEGFVMPLKLHDISHERDFFEGDFICRIVNSLPIFVTTSAMYTLVCVSFERNRAIIFSSQPRIPVTNLYIIIPVAWTLGLAASVPSLIEYSVNTITETKHTGNTTYYLFIDLCDSQTYKGAFSITNAIYIVCISYIVPVILMFRNYLQVALFVWKKRREIRDVSRETSQVGRNSSGIDVFRARIRAVKILVVVAVIFAVSWLPFYVMLLYVKITHRDSSGNAGSFVNLFLIAMATLSSTSDIAIYVGFNSNFRTIIKIVLRCSQCADGDRATS